MAALMRNVIGCVVLSSGLAAGVATAGPRVTVAPSAAAASSYTKANQLRSAGKYRDAIAEIDAGLAKTPNDQALLRLKGDVMLDSRDAEGAIAAYQAYIAAGAKGANKASAENIIQNLGAWPAVDITVSNGPADILLDSKMQGAICNAAPTCHKKLSPGVHKIIVERPGYQPVAQRITVQASTPAQVAVPMVEEPSLVTLRIPADAQATIDDAPYTAPVKLPAGSHRVVVTAPRHVEARAEAVAHEGKPVELELAPTPLVPVRVQPANAELVLDGAVVAPHDGGIAIARGAHHLVVRATGFRERSADIPAELPADYTVDIALDRVPPPSASPSLFTTRRKIAIGAGGVAVASLVVGIVLGKQSHDDDHNAFALCPDPAMPCADAAKANDLNKQGRDRATQANIAFGVAGAGAVAAAILWLTGAPERVSVTPHVGAVAGLDVGVRF